MNNYIKSVIDRLRSGQSVIHKEGGNSMSPKINAHQPVLLFPIEDENTLMVDDIVFCKVQSHFTHKIKSIKNVKGKRRYQISNLRGHVNGDIGISKIFGIVVAIGEDAIAKHPK